MKKVDSSSRLAMILEQLLDELTDLVGEDWDDIFTIDIFARCADQTDSWLACHIIDTFNEALHGSQEFDYTDDLAWCQLSYGPLRCTVFLPQTRRVSNE